MATTIQVSEATKQLLETVKKKEQARSYDQVIAHLVKTHAHISKSMFGSVKGLKWKVQDRFEFDEI